MVKLQGGARTGSEMKFVPGPVGTHVETSDQLEMLGAVVPPRILLKPRIITWDPLEMDVGASCGGTRIISGLILFVAVMDRFPD